MITELFTDIFQVSQYAPGVESSVNLDTLEASYLTARQQIKVIITQTVWQKLVNDYDSDIRTNLLSAAANRLMYEYAVFMAVSKNSGEQKLYKYQHEEIKDKYISNFWTAMNDILLFLDENPEYGDWQNSRLYQQRKDLPIKSAEEFDFYYGIDASPYFYYKILFLIRKIHAEYIRPRLKNSDIFDTDSDFADRVKRTLCYHVMAEAVSTFDLTELPRSIRYDFTHEYTKTGSMMQSRAELNTYFMKQVNDWYRAIESEIALQNGATDIEVTENKESNKHFLMS